MRLEMLDKKTLTLGKKKQNQTKTKNNQVEFMHLFFKDFWHHQREDAAYMQVAQH